MTTAVPLNITTQMVRTLAINESVCVRPVLRRVTDRATGATTTVAIPCGSTRESRCPTCAKKARWLRMTQCAEGWHRDDEPEEPDLEDTDDLGLGRPDFEPSAAETVPDQMAMIVELIRRESAYEREGDVYFRVGSFPEYGRLSNQKLDQLAEQEPNPLKEDPRDFALWKSNKPGEDTSWDSPWGRGRPGWHIECSAMSEKYLGETFEIHGGGLDLVFPHHENEIAQSRSLGHGFAQTWMHNGMLRFRGEEMHKSLGNAISLREVLDRWGRETVLLFFMTGHWSKPLDFSDETMAQTAAQAETFRNYFVGLEYEPGEVERDALAQILEQDFNTPGALALFHDWRRRGQTTSLKWGLDLFGLGSLAASAIAPPDLVELAGRRHAARAAREFAEADRLREEISAAGWEVRDVAEGFELVPK